MLVHKAQMLQILIAHRFIEGETTLLSLKSLEDCVSRWWSVTHVDNYGCDDHAALAPRLQNPITERNSNTSFHTECWTCSYQHPQNFHPLPKVHIPLLSNVATKSKPKWIFKKKTKTYTNFAQHASSYHRSRRRALSPVQPKRQPSRPPLLLNAPPLPSPANYAMWRRNVNSTPNLVPRWYRHERRRRKKKKTTTTRGNQRRWFKSEDEECWPFLLQRLDCRGREASKGGACATKLFLLCKSMIDCKLHRLR